MYVGATVQDITDTWFALVMRDVGAVVWRDLRASRIDSCSIWPSEHRDTIMAGRTHGQPGCADHLRLQGRIVGRRGPAPHRAARGRAPRWLVGQLGGAVGTLGFFAPRGAGCAPSSAPSWGWRTRASPG